MSNEITDEDMKLLKLLANTAEDKSVPPEIQGMRLSNFRNTATPAAILALIAKVESLNRSNLELSRRYDEQRLQEQRLDSALEREKSKVESLAADAERYRWLRHGDNDELVIQHGPVAPDYHWLPRNERLDEMIDARAILAAAGVSLEAK